MDDLRLANEEPDPDAEALSGLRRAYGRPLVWSGKVWHKHPDSSRTLWRIAEGWYLVLDKPGGAVSVVLRRAGSPPGRETVKRVYDAQTEPLATRIRDALAFIHRRTGGI
jgi:hypothetical protein